VNEQELERLAKQLGSEAAERLDVEATARVVLERLRQPSEEKKRITWIRPEWLRVAAALAVLLGAGVVLQKIGDRVMPSHYVLEDLSDLSAAELTVILSNLDRTLEADSTEAPLDLERLTPAQLEALLRSLETS
jgi:hypothetical protein